MTAISPLALHRRIADACRKSGDPDVAAFGEALAAGAPLHAFGLEYAPWLRRHQQAAARDRRDEAIARLGDTVSNAVEATVTAILAAAAGGRPPADPKQAELVTAIFRWQTIIHPEKPNLPPSRATVRRARSVNGRAWRVRAAFDAPSAGE